MVDLPSLADRASLREQVRTALRAAIVSGRLAPGEVHSAPALAARFGVSATPVREAMLDLVREGLVEPLRNKGFRITEVSERDLDDITEVRLLLEPPAVGEAARRATAEDVAALQPLAERIIEAAHAGDLAGYLKADRAFHVALLALAGNRLLVDVVADLRGRTRLHGLAALASGGGLDESAREHLALLDLLRAGDADGAAALTRRHLRHIRGRWAGRLEG